MLKKNKVKSSEIRCFFAYVMMFFRMSARPRSSVSFIMHVSISMIAFHSTVSSRSAAHLGRIAVDQTVHLNTFFGCSRCQRISFPLSDFRTAYNYRRIFLFCHPGQKIGSGAVSKKNLRSCFLRIQINHNYPLGRRAAKILRHARRT